MFLVYSKVIQLDIYLCVYVCVCVYVLFPILFHYSFLQDIENSSLSYIIGPCCLFTLYKVVCICQSQTINLSPLLPLGNLKFFTMSVNVS